MLTLRSMTERSLPNLFSALPLLFSLLLLLVHPLRAQSVIFTDYTANISNAILAMPLSYDTLYTTTNASQLLFSVNANGNDTTDSYTLYLPSPLTTLTATNASCMPSSYSPMPGTVAFNATTPRLCNYSLSFPASTVGTFLIAYSNATLNSTIYVGFASPTTSMPTLMPPFTDTTLNRSATLTATSTTTPTSTYMNSSGSFNFTLSWAGTSYTAFTLSIPANLTLNATSNPAMCGSSLNSTTPTTITLSYWLPTCNYTASWRMSLNATLNITAKSPTGWMNGALLVNTSTFYIAISSTMGAPTSSSSSSSGASSSSSYSSSSFSSLSASSSSSMSSMSSPSSTSSMSSMSSMSSSSMSSVTSSSMSSSSSTGLPPAPANSSGSNSAAGTAIGVILILAFLAVVGYIVYKKFIRKKEVFVSGINMTTPRMSRKGSYKGVVGSKPGYAPSAGADVNVKDDDEVVGEEDEEALEGEDEDEEVEEEEEEAEAEAKQQIRQPRRAV